MTGVGSVQRPKFQHGGRDGEDASAGGRAAALLAHPRLGLLAGGALVAVLFLVYSPAMRGGFLWDDDRHFSENPLMTAPSGLHDLWFRQGFYYPLTSTTFWLARRLWGLNPVPYHQLNILLHAANALLFGRLLARLKAPGAWLAAGMFALHPVHAQSVAWMTELKNVQSGFFYLLALLAWMDHLSGSRRFAYGLSLLCFVLALASKTSTVMLPAMLALIHLLRRDAWTPRRVAEWIPFFLLSLGAGALTILLHGPQVASGPDWGETPLQRVGLAGRCVWFYLSKLAFPIRLSFVYPRWDAAADSLWPYPVSLAVAFALLAFAARRSAAARAALLAFAAFTVSLFPVMNFAKMYYTRYSYVADHWQYLASMPMIALAAAALGSIRGRVVAGIVLLTFYGALTWRQARVYRDAEGLWRDTLRKNPGATVAWNNLAMIHAGEGDWVEAERSARGGLAIDPANSNLLGILGGVLAQEGRGAEALAPLDAALAKSPRDAELLNNKGLALAQTGKVDEACRSFQSAIAAEAGFVEAWHNWAGTLDRAGRRDEAAEIIRRGLRATPGQPILEADLRVLAP